MTFITSSKIVPSILIESYEEGGHAAADEALGKINSKKNGQSLLTEINNYSINGKRIKIIATTQEHAKATPVLTTSQIEKHKITREQGFDANIKLAYKLANQTILGKKGEGTSANILWNPKEGLIIGKNGEIEEGENPAFSFADLAHELVHGYRIMKGTFTADLKGNPRNPLSPNWNEERRAVGMGQYSSEPLSENGIRSEHGLQIRKKY